MIYRIELTKKAEKDFAALDKPVRQFLLEKLQTLEQSPTPLANAAKLINTNNFYRHRFGDYRVIFTIEQNGILVVLLILKIAHRKDIYKDL